MKNALLRRSARNSTFLLLLVFVRLNLGTAWHASLVVGASLANQGTSGRFDGVAPGARLASVSEGGSPYGHIEAAIKGEKTISQLSSKSGFIPIRFGLGVIGLYKPCRCLFPRS